MSDDGNNDNDVGKDAGPSPLLITDYEVTLLYDLMPSNFHYGDIRHAISAAIKCGIHPDDMAGIVYEFAGGDEKIENLNVPLAVFSFILQEARRSLSRNLGMNMDECKVSGTGMGVRYSGGDLTRAKEKMAELDQDSNIAMSLRSNLFVKFVLSYAD